MKDCINHRAKRMDRDLHHRYTYNINIYKYTDTDIKICTDIYSGIFRNYFGSKVHLIEISCFLQYSKKVEGGL